MIAFGGDDAKFELSLRFDGLNTEKGTLLINYMY
jgi:hypothetical protein